MPITVGALQFILDHPEQFRQFVQEHTKFDYVDFSEEWIVKDGVPEIKEVMAIETTKEMM